MSEKQRSVFASVDQDEMVKRLGQAPDGDIEAMLPSATSSNPAVLAGIEAFGDAATPATSSDELQAPEIGPIPVRAASPSPSTFEVVEFRGRLVDDLAASRAFILHGPAGVRRRS